MSYGINTRCIYGEEREQGDEKHYGALSYPIYQTATFQHPQVGVSSGYDYSRLSNPTRNQLESVVASLEKGTYAYAFSSGMAAITVAMEIFSQGSHVIAVSTIFPRKTAMRSSMWIQARRMLKSISARRPRQCILRHRLTL